MENEERDGKKPRDGRNVGGNGDLARRIAVLEEKIARLESPIVDCGYCQSTGMQADKDGKPLLDDNDRPVLCVVCKGLTKVRIP